MEISKMITISTAHIRKETADDLGSTMNTRYVGWMQWFSYYDKADYGWFIPTDYVEFEMLPKDLADCIRFALRHGCDWLCLDCDGEIVDSLPTYEW